MKRSFSAMRVSMAVMLAALLFSACKKSDYSNSNTVQSAALMAFNLAVDKPGVFITLSGNNLTSAPIIYTGYTGIYLNIYTGTRNIQVYDAGNTSISITSSDFTFNLNKYYSLFVVGANNVYSTVVTPDNVDSLSATNGKAYVRYINAIPDSSNPRVTITANGTTIADANAHFKTVSQFTEVTPGSVTVNVSNEATIQSNRTITLEKQKAYTVLLIGKPGETDSARAVQIRFVQNGTLTP